MDGALVSAGSHRYSPKGSQNFCTQFFWALFGWFLAGIWGFYWGGISSKERCANPTTWVLVLFHFAFTGSLECYERAQRILCTFHFSNLCESNKLHAYALLGAPFFSPVQPHMGSAVFQ